MLKTDLRKIRLVEIDEKLRVKAFKKTKMASIYKRAKGDSKGVLGGFSGVFKGIKRLHSDSIRLLKNAPKELLQKTGVRPFMRTSSWVSWASGSKTSAVSLSVGVA